MKLLYNFFYSIKIIFYNIFFYIYIKLYLKMSKRKNIWEKFKKIEIIGSGVFANVYFAIKDIKKKLN